VHRLQYVSVKAADQRLIERSEPARAPERRSVLLPPNDVGCLRAAQSICAPIGACLSISLIRRLSQSVVFGTRQSQIYVRWN
jgi:hypothetical protein